MRISRIILLIFILLIIAIGWKIYDFQKPFNLSDIPQWQVQVNRVGVWKLFAVEEPDRQTVAWFEGNPNHAQCDTIVIMGGLEEGQNLAVGALHLEQRANIIALRHPINQFFELHPWQEWGWYEWLVLPEVLKNEMAHTIGALKSIVDYIHSIPQAHSRFTEKVILAGGSFGGPFPVMLTSFQPERIAALMIIYGFTNYQLVLTRELSRQGLIHFQLDAKYQWFSDPVHAFQVVGVKALAYVLGFLLGNMLKYGYMELYFPQIYETPIYFINGRADHLVPKEAYDPMWDSAPDPKYQRWVEGDHIRPGKPEEVQALIDQMLEWGRSQKLWICHL